ncbi:MAG: dipeptide epimerase [Rickettsiales bacterium]|jgi:L-Ala-D/L-Glu epimerase|nr:dipeptide epimerase [Rickettsiales bacterium]
MKIRAYHDSWPIDGVFNIAHGSRTEADMVVCEISDGNSTGCGESYPYYRYNETVESVLAQIDQARDKIVANPTRADLLNILPAGSARCAVDLALWDLESKESGKAIWELAGLPKPRPVATAFTISIGSPDKVRQDVQKNQDKKILKMKLSGDELDKDRIAIARKYAPDAKIIIDANESWDVASYYELISLCQENNIAMIEQPFKSEADAILKTLERPIPICADESCHTAQDLKNLVGKYDMINIKLDKTGGLTEALTLYKEARALGFKVMVGCMVTTSLNIRPAYYLAQKADVVDIDGFVLLAKDRENGLKFYDSMVFE